MRKLTVLVLLVLAGSLAMVAQANPVTSSKPHVIEYYYKVKWGHQQEFLELFRKNHYPLLRKEIEMGRLLSVDMVTPRYHMTEDARWDYRVTIVFKDSVTAVTAFDEEGLARQVYP